MGDGGMHTGSGGGPSEDPGGAPSEDRGGGGAPSEEDRGDGGAPSEEDRGDGGAPSEEDRGDGGAPSEEDRGGGGAPSEEDRGGGGAPSEDRGGGGAPSEDRGGGGAPSEDRGGGGAPSEDRGGGGAPSEDRGGGGAPSEDPGTDVCESVFLDPNVELHTNNNNNNNRLQSASGKREAHSTDEDHDQQTEDFSPVPSTCTPSYNLGKGGEVKWSEGSMSALMIQDQLNINTTLPSDFGTSIVLDTGSGLMKAGFADENLPRVLFPTIIGVPKYEEIMNGSSEKDSYVGHKAQHMRGVLTLRHPIKHGIIRNWDDMERIWQHTFDLLRVDPAEHPVLLTEAPMNPLENRQRAMELMFEYFGVPYSYVAMQAVLALYAAGKTTGVVLDSGDGVTHSVPVYDGYVLPHAVQRFPLAGADVTAQLTKLLQEQGVCMRTTAEEEIVREMKEKCCCVALNYKEELHEGASCGEASYTMPDGKIVTLGTERIRAPEILFKPELIGRDHYGLHESVYKSILSSDLDLRRDFLGNVLLSGGNTLLPGLPERLAAELRALVPCEPRSCVQVSSPSDRDFSVWCGGAVLANLPSFYGLWISQSEYEEYGPQIVHRKCF
ncbi:actin-1 isoform X2 [Eucyclogobius newberryi]|uniref:actin-1 isoform X2 n=1 Tax=Eucyclogobius newberryi TaxID=166745 RepID=UPI003B5A6C81